MRSGSWLLWEGAGKGFACAEGGTKAGEGSLRNRRAWSCVQVIQAGIAGGNVLEPVCCHLSPLCHCCGLKHMKIGLKICKLELQV